MSFVSRVYENRRSAASVGVVSLFGAGLLGFALLYDGEATADVQLNDSGVWVTQTASGKVGRFNYEAKALDGTLLANSANFDVEQDAQRVLLDSVGDSSASPIEPAQLTLRGTMKFPAGAQVGAGGATTAVYDEESGKAWVLPFDGAVAFDEKKLKPTLKVGKGGTLAVGKDGTVFLAVPADGKLYTVPTSTQGTARDADESSLPMSADAKIQVTAVGDKPVVLNESTGNVVLPGGDAVEIKDASQGMLQQPSDKADNVVLATPSGLVSQPLGGGDATTRSAEGTPSAPVQLSGCVYGAWNSGQVIRDCEGSDNDVDERLEGIDASTRLAYRVNRNIIVLNDVANGALWMAADKFEKVDDWDLKMPEDAEGEKTESEQTTPEQVDQFVAQRDKANRPPVAKDDNFGVRPGRTTVLNVLGNDVDKDGDVMVAALKGEPDGDIKVNRVLDGAALQADVPADATGTTTFTYEVDDGRGGTDQASVDVRVVPLEENNPPVQSGEPVLRVGQDSMGTIKVLPYFRDPDGDDMFLSNASTADPLDEVRFRPDGTIEFRDGGTTTGRKIVDITVSDALGLPFQGRLLVDVIATNVPPVAVQDHVTVLAGEPATVRPMQNDFDPNGDKLRLTAVGEKAGLEITPNYGAGTFRVVSDSEGSYDLTYQITDGPEPTMGLVRVDVVEPPDEAGPPIAVSDQVLLPTGGSALVDVLANDTDPAGGVLVVQGVDVPDDAPVKVAVLNHQILKVSEVKRLDEPVTLTYTVANGAGTTTGQVRVVPIPAPAQLRPPEAGPDEATVHVGDVVTIPVLKNDTHPDGLELTLTDELQESPPAAAGEAFVSEDTVRFRAGQEAGTYHAVYEVMDSNGQKDSAQVTIIVKDDPENAAPQLPDITARVLAEGTTRIPLNLDGTDPDGDYVTLSAISGAPTQGTATIVDGFIDYTAAEDGTGLDTFTYQVTDTRGAVGEGLVRVGITPKPATNQPPQAADDETTVRPGRTVAVRALENDTDPDGDEIGLVESGFEGTGDMDPKVVKDDVVVTAPDDEGSYSFYYGIQDTAKAKASGAISVNVDQNAPLLRPIAHDDVVTADDVEGSSTVTVDVKANDIDPDGVAADLELSIDPDLEGVRITDEGMVEVELTQNARVITYTVTDMDGLEAKAFVRVPGDQARPHIKPGQEPLKATSGEPLTIDLADYVVVRDGTEPRITEEKTVKALEGKVVVDDEDTLVYTSAEDFAGGASVSFEVTDGDGPDDPEGLTAVLTLQIDVTPSKNMPPKITGRPVLEATAGEESSVDLSRYVKDPDKDPLTFTVKGVEGISPAVSGDTVSAEVDPSVSKGTAQELAMTVSDGKNPAVDAVLTVKVVASTRPLVQTTQDVVLDAHQGEPTTIPVLANDTNPFPGRDLTLSGVPTVETGQGTAEYRGDQLVVTPSEDFTGAMLVRYRVQDVTGDPDREVDGIAKLTVLGKPEPPRAPRVEEVRSQTVVLSWDQPNNNGADITGYTLRTQNGQEHACGTTTCTFDGLKNNVKYTFTVTATNEVGESDPSPASKEARPDEKPDQPAPPTLEFDNKSLKVSWKNKVYTDRSPIECVNLEISPAPADGVIQKTCVQGGNTTWTGLENGTAYTVRVQAKNAAPDPSDWSEPSAPETPAAPPAQPAAPTAKRANTAWGGQIDVSWTAPANNGDAVKAYYLDVYQDGNKVKTLKVSGTSQPVQDLNQESSYTFTVQAENKAGKSPVSGQSAAEPAYGIPTRPAGVQASNPGNGRANVSWNAIAGSDFRGPAHRYEVSANGQGSPSAGNATSYTYEGLNNGTSYTFQVRACNQYVCGDWSAASNAVIPFGPVPKPSISANGGDQKVTFTWDATAQNGRPTTVRVTGAISSTAKSGSQTASAGYSDAKEACVTVTDSENQSAKTCATGTSDARPNPRAWVTHGSSINNNECSHSSCAYFKINTKDFPAGNHSVACWAGDTPEVSGWHDIVTHGRTWETSNRRTYNIPANGQVQLNCFFGHPGAAVAVMIDGTRYEATNW
ncbi:Ig-like domain-containing protein [Promicromonospora sukumoe]|uniref:Ig-like domain-containing protein n=1 Tax=Promicromonospora sukumoe TaxID=88382 RepID=UPI00039F48AD|nr:Ig-like domain-containing protein [Promicromonospora sukumoe]